MVSFATLLAHFHFVFLIEKCLLVRRGLSKFPDILSASVVANIPERS
jgi:hypothetical protein